MTPRTTPVLIVGSGSAGLCAAVWLARCKVPCTILEKRDGPLEVGQADGVQCRTVEVFESFGIEEGLLREGYWVNEVAFWDVQDMRSAEGNVMGRGLVRTNRTPDTEPGLSHHPHVILNQARVNGMMIEAMNKFNAQGIEYGCDVKDVKVNGEDAEYPVTVTAVKNGEEQVWKAKYVLGCDGAHSTVRRSLGYKMVGDSTDTVWGVMDIYPRTTFPDIRKKATIHSDAGNMLIIPREGGSLCRFYIQLPPGKIAKEVKKEDLHETARKILSQYTLDIAETYWWSAYPIGQRFADNFHKDFRVFLTGDACHTHSPKAGQGMNTSLQDGYNMGWKLAAVVKGKANPSLVQTYVLEREKVAKDLIEFDRAFSKLFSSKASEDQPPEYFSQQFIKAGRYTAGMTATYGDSMITATSKSNQSLAKNTVVGMRFPSAQVVRFCDTKAMQLVKALPSDERWRIVVFAGDASDQETARRLQDLASYLDSSTGPVHKYTDADADIDSFIETIVVFYGSRTRVEQKDIPKYYWPVTGQWKMTDLHKVFFDDRHANWGHGHAYEKYGVAVEKGAIVVVRPDHYVAGVSDIEDHAALGNFFDGFCQRKMT